jgi:hypothetical protein
MIMQKLKLKLDDLRVDSFDTIAAGEKKGTVFGEQCTCQTVCTCPGCATCDASCNSCPSCPGFVSCDAGTCPTACPCPHEF